MYNNEQNNYYNQNGYSNGYPNSQPNNGMNMNNQANPYSTGQQAMYEQNPVQQPVEDLNTNQPGTEYPNQQYEYSTNSYVEPTEENKPSNSKVKDVIYIIIIILLIIFLVLVIGLRKEKYAVVFVNGDNIDAMVVEEGKTISEKAVSDTTGFLGWYQNGQKYDFNSKVTDHVILRAMYDNTKTYQVTFDTDGGSSISSVTVKENEKLQRPADPVRTGYNFVEWQLNGVTYDFDAEVSSNMTLVAKWERNTDEITYTVVFDTDGGNKIADQTIKENEKVSKPKDPTKTGYKFVEWQLNGKTYKFNEVLTENITLKAIWEAKETVQVTFDTDGGNTIKPLTAYKGEKIGTLPTPTKEGYKFDGWYAGTTKYTSTTLAKSDVTLKAKWIAQEKVTVTFDSDGGSAVSSISVYTGEKIGTLPTPTRTDYKFDGWYDGNTKYTSTTVVKSNVTLKAKWIVYKKVTVTFDSDGGSAVSSISVYTGEKIGTLPTPTKSGYKFDGWYNGNTKYTSTTIVNDAITLKAKWISAADELLSKAIASIKSSYDIEKAGTEIKPTYDGCTITHLTQDDIAKITRGTSDKTITLEFEVKCGTASKTVTSKGVIKKSPYTYTATANSNMVNYDLVVKNGSATVNKNGAIFSASSSSQLSELQSGKAVINNGDIEGFPNFRMKFSDDKNTIYVITKK